MKTIETKVRINASPQTVWSVMDDLQNYPEWNRLTADLTGRTTVGSILRGTLTKGGASPAIALSPTITAIVGAREFRWLTKAPGFHAEHYFLLRPMSDGGTCLVHGENFDGPLADERWEGILASTPKAYDQLNDDLKRRAEGFRASTISLHPAVDHGPSIPNAKVQLTKLRCHCAANAVVAETTGPIYHNHLCGCSKCWKPEGALFAQSAVTVRESFHVIENEEQLTVVDPSQSIQRYACSVCGTHMYGSVSDDNHHFYGLVFIHPELACDVTYYPPEFAGFVSSIIESGTCPSMMSTVRGRLEALGIPAFDGFSSELMDIIAWHRCKISKLPNATS